MAWEYTSGTIAPISANTTGSNSWVNFLLDLIDSRTGWSVGAAAAQIGAIAGASWGYATHTSGARFAIATATQNSSSTCVSASNSYTGGSLTATNLNGHMACAYIPAAEAGTIPDINTGTALGGQFLYSIATGASFTLATTNRVHVLADGGRLIVMVQRNTASATINDIVICGDFLDNLVNTGDTRTQMQWVGPSFTAATDSATGAGQAFSAAGTRILSMTPIAQTYLLAAARQSGDTEYTLLPIWYSSSTTAVATGNGVKGFLKSADIVAGPSAVTTRATVQSSSRIHVGSGYYVPWDASFGNMP
jgi:hypothetical protein